MYEDNANSNILTAATPKQLRSLDYELTIKDVHDANINDSKLIFDVAPSVWPHRRTMMEDIAFVRPATLFTAKLYSVSNTVSSLCDSVHKTPRSRSPHLMPPQCFL